MEFSREILFFFSALGAFNGLAIGLYFILLAKPRTASNYFLGFLLLTLSIRTGKSVFLYFNQDLAGTFLQLGMSACLFIGPSLYFYLKTVVTDGKISDWKYHFIPLLIAILAIDVIYPWDQYPHYWRIIFRSIYAIWFIYIVLAGYQIRNTLKKLLSKVERLSRMEVWVVSVFIGNCLVWLAYNTVNYTSYIVGALSFSFIFYLMILLVLFTRKKDAGFLSRQVKYGNKKIDAQEADQLRAKLSDLMSQHELYKDPNLKLSDIANRLHILPHRLSQFLNDNLGKNFTGYINEYRIDAAKELIANRKELKLESIGYQCGFNSKSTFYSTFKRVSGMTPANYKEQIES